MTGRPAFEAGTGQAAGEYVTVRIGGQLFGLPILDVQDVFRPESITCVPLAQGDVAGVLNLRGRIVTAIDMRTRLGLPPWEGEEQRMAVGVEYKGESYGLFIDRVGEVRRVPHDSFEANPANLDPRWAAISAGVHRLDGELMVVLDIARVLALADARRRAA